MDSDDSEEEIDIFLRCAREGKIREADHWIDFGCDNTGWLVQAYERGSKELRLDQEVAIELVSRRGFLLEIVHPDLCDDLPVVTAALTSERYGWEAYRYMSEERKSDPELLRLALESAVNQPDCHEYVADLIREIPDDLKRDKANALWVFQAMPDDVCARMWYDEVHRCSREELRHDDREAAVAVVSLSGSLLKYSSEAHRDDLEVVTAALTSEHDGWKAFQYMSERRKSDPELFCLALESAAEQTDRHECVDEVLRQMASAAKGDKDKLLLLFRAIPDDIRARVKLTKSGNRVALASGSALAVKGEKGAPVLTVTTLCLRANEEVDSGDSFHCEANLLSGATITCQIPNQRPSPTLNDLALRLVEKLSEGQAAPKHVFINFLKEDGDIVEVSVWDFHRPLSDFLSADESEVGPQAAASP